MHCDWQTIYRVNFADPFTQRVEKRFPRCASASSEAAVNPPSEDNIDFKRKLIAASLLASLGVAPAAATAADTLVGVSWCNFQEERRTTDEAAIKG